MEKAMAAKRAFITGITGMVGSHLADYLIAKTDWDIVGLCRWRSPLDNLAPSSRASNRGERIRLVYGDLRDELSISEAVRQAAPDYVFHLAAQSFPRTSFDAPLDTLDTNVQGTARVLEAVRSAGRPRPVVHVCSSSEVFGRVPKEKLPIDEECTFHPASPYAISKVGTDLLGRFYAEAYGMCGDDDAHVHPHRAAPRRRVRRIDLRQADRADRGRLIPPVVKVGNLESLRTVADVRDAVRAYHMLVTVNPVPAPTTTSAAAIAARSARCSTRCSRCRRRRTHQGRGRPARLRPIDADLQVPDTSKFAAHTGWEPEIPFEQTMRDLLDYWREEGGASMAPPSSRAETGPGVDHQRDPVPHLVPWRRHRLSRLVPAANGGAVLSVTINKVLLPAVPQPAAVLRIQEPRGVVAHRDDEGRREHRASGRARGHALSRYHRRARGPPFRRSAGAHRIRLELVLRRRPAACAVQLARRRSSSKRRLADEAIHLEQTLLKENVGIQDQIAAAFGGLNRVDIGQNGDYAVQPVLMSEARQARLFRGAHDPALHRHRAPRLGDREEADRRAAREGIRRPPHAGAGRRRPRGARRTATICARSATCSTKAGELKRSLSDAVSTATVDEIYDARAGGRRHRRQAAGRGRRRLHAAVRRAGPAAAGVGRARRVPADPVPLRALWLAHRAVRVRRLSGLTSAPCRRSGAPNVIDEAVQRLRARAPERRLDRGDLRVGNLAGVVEVLAERDGESEPCRPCRRAGSSPSRRR
jgi:GDP-mannose 4,6-dehydratase